MFAKSLPSAVASSVLEKRRSSVPPRLWFIFVGLSLLLLTGSVYRAVTFPFVHDESLSFAIFTFEPRARGYGIGLAALMGSLVLLARGSEEVEVVPRRLRQLLPLPCRICGVRFR